MILTCTPLDDKPFQFYPGTTLAAEHGCTCPPQGTIRWEVLVDEDCPLHDGGELRLDFLRE